MRIQCLAIVILFCFSGILLADEILLKNGNVVKGTITEENEEFVIIEVSSGKPSADPKKSFIRQTIKQNRIKRIKKGRTLQSRARFRSGTAEKKSDPVHTTKEPPKKTDSPPITKTDPTPSKATVKTDAGNSDGDGKSTNTKKGSTTKKDALPVPDPAMEKLINSLIQALEKADDKKRTDLVAKLAAMGEISLVQMVEALKQTKSRRQKIGITHALKKMGGTAKPATRELIEQMRGGIRDSSRMKTAYFALKAVTGKRFFFDEDHSLRKRNVNIQKWLDWLEGEVKKEAYPEQIGYEEKEEEEKKP